MQTFKTNFPAFASGGMLIALIASIAFNVALFKGNILLPENSCHDLIDSLHVMQADQAAQNYTKKGQK